MSWQRIVGHDHWIEAFTRVARRHRLAHAYLFVGPAGVGKRMFAEELAKALLCEQNDSNAADFILAACDRCDACLQVEARTHPDFFLVARPEEKNEIPVESMRALCGSFGLKPARGKGKIAILDDADDLNEESANCFLKTLEEPPPRSIFFLIGTSVERQMATVVSRCQVVRFAPLPGAVLQEVLRKQGVADAAHVKRLVRLAGGSAGRALALADPALWQFRQTLLAGLTRAVPDTVGLGRAWTKFGEDAGKEGAAQRLRAHLTLQLLVHALQDALTLSLGGNLPEIEADEAKVLNALAGRLGPEKIMQMLERCLEAEIPIDRYVQLPLVLEALVDAVGQIAAPAQGAPAGSMR